MADSGGQKLKDLSYVEVDFVPDPGFALNFDGMKGQEELGRPFLFEIDLTSGDIVGDVSRLVGSSATVWLAQSDPSNTNEADKYINGIVTRVVSEGLARGAYHYRVEIRPWIWLLTRVTDCCIFQNKTAFDIVTSVFRTAGFSDFEDKRQSASGNTELEYCVQYRETTFDFVSRLMEQFGFYYFFKHDKTKHTLVFADDPNAHQTLTDKIPYQFDQTEFRTVADHFWEWSSDLGLYSGKFTFQDYDFKKPAVDLTAKTVKPASHAKYGTFEVYEYPGPYDTAATGQTLTNVRMQAIAAQRAVFRGASNSRKLHAGWKFKLDQYPDKSLNKEYLITRSEIALSIAEGMSTTQDQGETLDTYRVVTHAIPGDVPFRLHRTTKRPMIRGPQTARVVGAPGDEITTDEYGRIKVKFHWDRSETEDDRRTCWIRVAQSWAGASWGSLFIPRVGMEVVVEFLEGDPDRPLVTGVVYNANMKLPYPLPAEKTKTTIKTNSSQGGNGFNELRFDDKAGSEEIFLQAQKDYVRKVLNDETVTIHKDTTWTVETGNRSVTLSQGNDTLTVSAGNHKITVTAGKSETTAGTSITMTVGASSIKIGPAAIEITAPQVKLTATGSMTLNGGASMALTAGTIAIN